MLIVETVFNCHLCGVFNGISVFTWWKKDLGYHANKLFSLVMRQALKYLACPIVQVIFHPYSECLRTVAKYSIFV